MNTVKGLGLTILLSISNAILADATAGASGSQAGSKDYSEIAPRASRALLLDVAHAGTRIVVVGDRGHILLSDDNAATWKQAKVPTQALLTAVYFIDNQHGWAVGHDETVIRTLDGGVSWQQVHSAPENQQPLLDVWFRDAQYGLAVGAYGTILATNDGGVSWARQTFEPQARTNDAGGAAKDKKGQNSKTSGVNANVGANADSAADTGASEEGAADRHLNAIARSRSGTLYLAAEAGHLFRSDDDGKRWRELPSPYEGSFFGVLPLDGDTVLAFGLRGHLFRSDDGGEHWTAIPTGTTAMLTDAVRLNDQRIVVSGLAGSMLVSRDAGLRFALEPQAGGKGVQALLPLGQNKLLTAGEGGIGVVTP